jgi:hypothetical protein
MVAMALFRICAHAVDQSRYNRIPLWVSFCDVINGQARTRLSLSNKYHFGSFNDKRQPSMINDNLLASLFAPTGQQVDRSECNAKAARFIRV